jgi:predicted phosphodiesterase
MEGHDLTTARVSGDDAVHDVIKLRATLAKVRRELSAVTKDRDELLIEYGDLQKVTYPVKPPKRKKKIATGDTLVRVIASDLHGSVMDRPAVDAFLADVKSLNPDEIVLNGDIVECGGFLAQHHALGYVAQTEYSFQQDIAAANWFLDELGEAAPRAQIHFISGNHDERVSRWIVDQTMRHGRDSEFLMSLLAPQVLLRLEERGIAFYCRGEHHLPGLPPGWIKLGNCFFTHELSGGKNAARSSLQSVAANVVFGHTHQEDAATIVLPGVGIVKAWNPGCLCERQPLWRHSNPTSWSHGYAVQFCEGENLMHVNVPIWEGVSQLQTMIRKFAP